MIEFADRFNRTIRSLTMNSKNQYQVPPKVVSKMFEIAIEREDQVRGIASAILNCYETEIGALSEYLPAGKYFPKGKIVLATFVDLFSMRTTQEIAFSILKEDPSLLEVYNPSSLIPLLPRHQLAQVQKMALHPLREGITSDVLVNIAEKHLDNQDFTSFFECVESRTIDSEEIVGLLEKAASFLKSAVDISRAFVLLEDLPQGLEGIRRVRSALHSRMGGR